MTYVKIDPKASRHIAEQFGPKATRFFAEQIAAKARMLADARAKRSSVSDRINVEHGNRPQDARVVMSVRGGDGSEVAAHLEWGYVNARSGKRIPGKHILRDATFGV
ncbi:MAG: hypothetical protein J6575_03485 [Bifidobacterium sp.]|nr:hypothetical protein [Bifidobacterium sp.]